MDRLVINSTRIVPTDIVAVRIPSLKDTRIKTKSGFYV